MIDELLWFPTDKCLIDGAWNFSEAKAKIEIMNPSNERVIARVARASKNDVENAVVAAEHSLTALWGKKTALERGRILTKMSELVIKYAKKLALLESLDVGKPLSQSKMMWRHWRGILSFMEVQLIKFMG